MLGLDIVNKTNINLQWQTNIFSFNYKQINKIKSFAESKGAKFISYKTSRFGRDDLIPPVDYVDTSALYSKELLQDTNVIIDPKCRNVSQHSISADHYFFACSWMSAVFVRYKSKMWKEKEKWSIHNQTYDNIRQLMVKPWVNDIVENMSTCDVFCKMKCKVGQEGRVKHE
jgi:hypothetical protein